MSTMPFLRAGFNARSRDTGIRACTRNIEGRRYAPAEFRQFAGGDYFWLHADENPRWLAWGEQCVIGTWSEFKLLPEWQQGLPMSAVRFASAPRSLAATLELPYPVTANLYWRHVPNKKTGRTMHFLSDEAVAYKKAVGWIAKAAGFKEPTRKPIEIARITLVPKLFDKNGRRLGVCMDLGNCWKVAEDALQGVVYINDRQIKRFGSIEYGEPTKLGGLIVEVKEFVPLFELIEEG